ncbi:MAG: hypothetical protein DRJ09_10475 [Bacteroidetes bacterium]|nr:MAG: hypothetical protein DRJ09_10475 [Bacteroidota bacterium]
MLNKIFRSGIILMFVAFTPFTNQAQNKCKVLVKEISAQYHGKCKKGLAKGKGKAEGVDTYTGHFKAGYPEGKGTYLWANGDSYTGEWEQGKRSGEGVLTLHFSDGDSIVKGLWKDDKYLGPVPPKPEVIHSTGVDRYTFLKTGNLRNRVLIDVYQNGSRNKALFDLMISSTSGSKAFVGNSFGYEFIDFPVRIKVMYYTYNKLHSQQIYVKFEFVISEPGDWRLTLYN